MCWPRRLLCAGLLILSGAWPGAPHAEEPSCKPLVPSKPLAAARIEHGHGLLWRITGATGGDSFLFGSMHVDDPRVMRVLAQVDAQFNASSTFALEVVIDQAATQKLGAAMFYSDGQRLSAVAGETLFQAATQRLANYGIPPPLAEAIKPWAAFITLSMPASGNAEPLDLHLMAAATKAGKRVLGLETIEEQIGVFESISATEQLDMLREAVCNYTIFQQELQEMVEAYVARDLAALMQQSLRYASPEKDAFMDKLLWQRNARMAARMTPLLEAGHAFITVGALHLPGERGILHLLEQRGYRVEALY